MGTIDFVLFSTPFLCKSVLVVAVCSSVLLLSLEPADLPLLLLVKVWCWPNSGIVSVEYSTLTAVSTDIWCVSVFEVIV